VKINSSGTEILDSARLVVQNSQDVPNALTMDQLVKYAMMTGLLNLLKLNVGNHIVKSMILANQISAPTVIKVGILIMIVLNVLIVVCLDSSLLMKLLGNV